MTPMLLNTPLFTSDWKVLQENSAGVDYPRLILTGKFQEAVTPNNNRRKYRLETLQEKIINARCTPEKLASDALLGENIHPDDKLTSEINSEKVIWKILEAKMEGNIMVGSVEIIPELTLGKAMYFLVEKYGAKPGISTRGFGAMDGDWVDHDSYKFVTLDGTFNPSTHGAFLKKLGETSEIKEFVKSFSGKDIKCLSESSILRLDSGKSMVENIFGKSYHILNERKDMSKELELLQESNKQVASLSVEVSQQKTTIAESKKTLKEMEDELDTAKGDVKTKEDELAVAKEESKKLKEAAEEKEDEEKELKEKVDSLEDEKKSLEENYAKALKVAEGMTEKYHAVNGFYGKSIEVLNLMENTKADTAISSLVEKELGEDHAKEVMPLFEGKSIGEATVMVESLKKIQLGTGKKPTKKVPLTERKLDKDGNVIKESGDGATHDESRINAYDI